MMFDYLNWIAIGLAALSTFLIGGLWYSKLLFGKTWMKLINTTESEIRTKGKQGLIFLFAFLAAVAKAILLAALINIIAATLFDALILASLISLCFAAAYYGTHFLFERKPFKLWLIHFSYDWASTLLMAFIIYSFLP